MRVPTLFTALSLAALAAAQRPQEFHEAMVWDAYQNFRADSDTYVFEMRGSETVGNSVVPVHAVLYWRGLNDPRTGMKSRAQAELDVYEPTATGERMSLRIVGDGAALHRYDLRRGTVSSTMYGFYGDKAPDRYFTDVKSDAPRLASQMRTATPGLPTYLARLVSEMNLASGMEFGPRFASWSPGSRPLFFDEVPLGLRALNGEPTADDVVTDPITARPFVRGTDQFVFYGYDGSAPSRTVAFRLYDADPNPDDGVQRWEVLSVSLAFLSPGRKVDLTILPKTGTVPAWAFVPYGGAEGAAFRPATPER